MDINNKQEQRDKYKKIIYLIAEKVENKKELRYIRKNIETIVTNLIQLSNYIDSISEIILSSDTYEKKINRVQYLVLS